jgi:hypothetical protein
MPTTKKTSRSGDEEVVPDVHAEAAAERMRAPTVYDDPTIATPGVLEDVEGEAGPQALVDSDTPSGLDTSVDNRDQVQPMLDTLYKDAVESAEATPEEQAAQLEESRKASREAAEKSEKK